MVHRKQYIFIVGLIVLSQFFLGGCRGDRPSRFKDLDSLKPESIATNLDRIRKDGVLNVVTDYNSISYFIYRGQPMGFQFEMLQALADHMELELDVSVSNDLAKNFRDLNEGVIDLIAMNLTVTAQRKQQVHFTSPLLQTRQVLVQRKPEHWKEMNSKQVAANVIRNQLNLAGKTVYVQTGSVYAKRLQSLSNDIGGGLLINEVQLEAEQLIQRVALGEIDFTICDENVGLVNATYFPQLDVSTAVSFPQNVAWAVNLMSDSLKADIDIWIKEYKNTNSYALLYSKYFRNRHNYRNIHSEHYALSSGNISKFDNILKEESKVIDWDWRLLASLVYQESRFNQEAVSWAGAMGLMQLMPGTAMNYGVSMEDSPRAHIKAGIKFIKWLDDRFRDDIPDEEERIKFILGGYNIGYGHIQDARRLAVKHDDDPNIWMGSVEEWLLKKSDPDFYSDPVVKYGYARGIETYNYVREILERYEHYKNIIKLDAVAAWKPLEEIHRASSQ